MKDRTGERILRLEMAVGNLRFRLRTIYNRTYASTVRKDRERARLLREGVKTRALRSMLDWLRVFGENEDALKRMGRLVARIGRGQQIVHFDRRERAQLKRMLKRRFTRRNNKDCR